MDEPKTILLSNSDELAKTIGVPSTVQDHICSRWLKKYNEYVAQTLAYYENHYNEY